MRVPLGGGAAAFDWLGTGDDIVGCAVEGPAFHVELRVLFGAAGVPLVRPPRFKASTVEVGLP